MQAPERCNEGQSAARFRRVLHAAGRGPYPYGESVVLPALARAEAGRAAEEGARVSSIPTTSLLKPLGVGQRRRAAGRGAGGRACGRGREMLANNTESPISKTCRRQRRRCLKPFLLQNPQAASFAPGNNLSLVLWLADMSASTSSLLEWNGILRGGWRLFKGLPVGMTRYDPYMKRLSGLLPPAAAERVGLPFPMRRSALHRVFRGSRLSRQGVPQISKH
ncbi:hypothetical protein B0T24DRAFT_593591 [Lasiosphaeria ovina]|uniref:Uncharacterized protein n=1 Tax=Lasiosphaeria ovina TaxID=92902 RepID=A0AAE0KBD1_9PEZI|nr:hypothetical protein B0T24DRAFT_593591 [Lasiosphaeria ovina]